MTKVYDLKSDEKLNGDFGTVVYDDDRENDNKEHIPRVKGLTIKKKNKNKPSFPTVKETSLKSNQNKERN